MRENVRSVFRDDLLSAVRVVFGDEAERDIAALLAEKSGNSIHAEEIIVRLRKHTSEERFPELVMRMFVRKLGIPPYLLSEAMRRANLDITPEEPVKEKFTLGGVGDSFVKKDRKRISYKDLGEL